MTLPPIPQVLSVNVGLPREHWWQGRVVRTAIFKEPVSGPVALAGHNLAGDAQADLRVHGGPDKAVYAYAHEHYAYWESVLPAGTLPGPGAFGENLTTQGLLETEVRVGDEFEIGTAVLRAVQPRQPCHKLNLRFDDPRMVPRFVAAGRSGIYFQVRRPGVVQAGDALVLCQPSPFAVTIQDVVDLYYGVRQDAAAVQTLLAIPYLPASLRAHFQQQAR
ncbi:MOSC domain-containing protein [Hymenobacter arizonensis]|uniref:MOSC domain-containing protein YiiM n=1 Tax=Hymenobacter arizonensis TaxID=1227077 RepID=A0A1I5Z799_HYMAR|nr:MOSC domain-containing protein [Hymenobacter arizonensis]SFQ52330.1 MOSC domain-containing protein YiiM [Hymenobacter arizonensis]